jgi:hypothetical protein
MSGKRKTLSRYKKNKNDTTRKKRTKRSDSRFKRSSNKAITKQIGGTRASIAENKDQRITEILEYLYGYTEEGGKYNWDILRLSLTDHSLIVFDKGSKYISLNDISSKLTLILRHWYSENFGIFLSTDESREIGLIVESLLNKLDISIHNVNGFPYVEWSNFLHKLKHNPSETASEDVSSIGAEDELVDYGREVEGKAELVEAVVNKEGGQPPKLYHFGIEHSENVEGGRYISFIVPHRSSGYIPYEYILYLKPRQRIEQFVRGPYGLDCRLGNVKELLLVNVDTEATDTGDSQSDSSNSINNFLQGEIVEEDKIKRIPEVEKLLWGANDKLEFIMNKIENSKNFIIVIKDHIRESIDESYEESYDESYELGSESRSESGSESEGVSGYLVLNEPESSPGGEAEWDSDISPDDIQQFTMMVRLSDLRTGEETDPLELYKKIKIKHTNINISEITDKMIIEYSREVDSRAGSGTESDAGSYSEEGDIPGIIDRLKEKSGRGEYRNLYEELKIFHKILEENPNLIDSLLGTYKSNITEGITNLERVEYNTKITVLNFLKSYLDGPPTRNDTLMRNIFLDDYRYVFLMN